MPLDTQYEDQSRYTAPPDPQPEPPAYLASQIMRYVGSWCPGAYNHHYSLDEVREILKNASDNLTDEDHGIDTV